MEYGTLPPGAGRCRMAADQVNCMTPVPPAQVLAAAPTTPSG